MRRHTVSFKHAFDGIMYVFRTQPNFQFHSVVAILVLWFSWFVHITREELVILLFTIMLVLVAEMLNTAIEAITDLVTTKRQPYAKIAKDVAAGMVLMSAILAVFVGLTIFGPYVIRLLNS